VSQDTSLTVVESVRRSGMGLLEKSGTARTDPTC
jgi:hypothetical protein